MDIHNYDKQIEGMLRRLEKSSVSDTNKAHILRFFDYLRAVGLSKARINRYLQYLKCLGETLTKDFKTLTKDDMIHVVGELEAKDYSVWTKVTYKRMLIKFMTWLYDTEVKPPVVSWIKVQHVKSRRLPEELLTQEEVKILIEVAKNPRDRALVSTHTT